MEICTHAALDAKLYDVVWSLVDKAGVDINAQPDQRQLSLDKKAFMHYEDLDLILFFIEKGANIPFNFKKNTVAYNKMVVNIHEALDAKQYDRVKFLIEKGVNIDAQSDQQPLSLVNKAFLHHEDIDLIFFFIMEGGLCVTSPKEKIKAAFNITTDLKLIKWFFNEGVGESILDKSAQKIDEPYREEFKNNININLKNFTNYLVNNLSNPQDTKILKEFVKSAKEIVATIDIPFFDKWYVKEGICKANFLENLPEDLLPLIGYYYYDIDSVTRLDIADLLLGNTTLGDYLGL